MKFAHVFYNAVAKTSPVVFSFFLRDFSTVENFRKMWTTSDKNYRRKKKKKNTLPKIRSRDGHVEYVRKISGS